MEAYYQSSIMPRELGNDRDSRTIAIYDIKRVSLTTFKFRFIDNDWRLIYKKAEHCLIKMRSKDLIEFI